MLELSDETLRRLEKLEKDLRPVPWLCFYCQHAHQTAQVLWGQLRFHLVCENCGAAQNYPDHIRKFDASPPEWYRRQTR